MRQVAIAIENYMVEYNQYPASAKGDLGINAHLPEEAAARHIHTFRAPPVAGGKLQFGTLTTPVAFLATLPLDPFVLTENHKRAHFGYCNHQNLGWVLFSPGPDGDYDVDPEMDYNATGANPTPELLLKVYDTSNGIKSSGDIVYIMGVGIVLY